MPPIIPASPWSSSAGGFDGRYRRTELIFWSLLALGAMGAATVANVLFATYLPRFYLMAAITIEFGGAIVGVLVRPSVASRLLAHIFDPVVSLANRLFRLSIALLLPVAGLAFVLVSIVLDGEWRVALNPNWRDWPYVLCLAWGFISSLTMPKPHPAENHQQSS